jgi:VWFA-related protein
MMYLSPRVGRLQDRAFRAGVRKLVIMLSAASLASLQAQEPPNFTAQSRLVVLQATVVNSKGDLVTNLNRDAFTVREDGKPQTITQFAREDVPVSLGIVIDNSGSMRGKRQTVETAALAFVRASNPQDEVFVMNFADEPHLDVPFTTNLGQLEAGISRADAIGGTAMRDAVDAAMDYLVANATRDRRALLVVSDGQDNTSLAPLDRIRHKVEHNDVTIFAIGLLAGETSTHASRARHELEDCAELTGGRAFFPERLEDINATVLDVAHQLRNQYTIAYAPQNQALDDSYRKIHVVVRGPNRLSVRTRAGYVASRDEITNPRTPIRSR